VRLDSVTVAFEGIELEGHGVVDSLQISGIGQLGITDFRLARRFIPELDSAMEASATLKAQLSGTPQRPSITAYLSGGFQSSSMNIPLLQGSFIMESGSPRLLSLDAPRGATVGSVILNQASAEYVPSNQAAHGLQTGSVALYATAQSAEFFHRARVDARDGFRAVGDTLFLSIESKTLISRHPYEFEISPDGFRLSDLDLDGSLGWVRGNAALLADDTELAVDAHVDLAQPPSFLSLPSGFQPRSIDLSAQASLLDQLTIQAQLLGFNLGSRRSVEGRADVIVRSPGARFGIAVVEEQDTLLVADGEVPLEFSLQPFRLEFLEKPVIMNATATEFPLPRPLGTDDLMIQYFRGTPGLSFPLFTGKIVSGGRVSELTSGISGTVAFPGVPGLSRYHVSLLGIHSFGRTLDQALLSSHEIPTQGIAGRVRSLPFAWPGIVGELSVGRSDTVSLAGFLALPLPEADETWETEGFLSRQFQLELKSSRINLEDFSPILPHSVDLNGSLLCDLSAAGQVGNPALTGKATVSELEVVTADGSRVSASGMILLRGSAEEPIVSGELTIERGIIRIPDAPRSLHPVEGEALLWNQTVDLKGNHPVSLNPDLDTTHAVTTTPPQLETAVNHHRLDPEIQADVSVRVPGRLWIRGRGLDVELAGELQTVLRNLKPTAVGELRAVSGSLLFLGRRFLVEQGQVVFFGDDEINPSLDLVLSTRLDDTVIRITVSGTAKEPDLTLSSDPELSEGDIMAYLVFGKRLDELDSDQTTFVRSRALELAKSSALAKLEDRLSRELGVDLLTVKQGDGQGGKGSIVVGKYISSRALVRFEQALDAALGYMITLEYWLARNFVLLTYLSHIEQSGLEINWTRDY
jgi:hypothetical protein